MKTSGNMHKENHPPQRRIPPRPVLFGLATGEENCSPITRFFTASKPLTDRKRPRDANVSPLLKCRSGDGVEASYDRHRPRPESLSRIPMSEIDTNRSRSSCEVANPEQESSLRGASAEGPTLPDALCTPAKGLSPVFSTLDGNGATPLSETVANRSEPGANVAKSGRKASGWSARMESAASQDLLGTPAQVSLPVIPGVTPCCSSGATPVSFIDDEFDEALLQEIDEIIERSAPSKVERMPSDQSEPCQSSSPCDKRDERVMNADTTDFMTTTSKEAHCCSQEGRQNSAPQAYIDYWAKLNEKQREAACSDITVPLMIIAGPGSGKTSTMVGRVLKLLNEGIPPKNILAMTFTTAAASEMRERIAKVVGKAIAKELVISTFHSFCLQLCRLHAEKLGFTSEFVIYGHGQERKAIIEALRLLENKKKGIDSGSGCDDTSLKFLREKTKKWEKFVRQAKASGKTPDECLKMGDILGASVLENYNAILKSCNALDYQDFIIYSIKLLSDFSEVSDECRDCWKAIVVDEFQDTSSMQYTLLLSLSSHRCLTIIGDEDQSIFSFNGANICGFDSFRKDFPVHKEVRLSVNYRSTRCIVEAASALIHCNSNRCKLKQVETDNSPGCKISLKECPNEAAQCSYVIDKIVEITSDNLVTKKAFGDIAVLYRRQATGKIFQASFRDRKVPFNVHGVAFYRKKIIKTIISILQTTLPGCGDPPFCRSFKALLPGDKEEKKKVIEHIEKICHARKCSFYAAAKDIFNAKVSGTFKRCQLSNGKKVLSTLDMLSKLVHRERSLSAVVTSVATMIPQHYLLEKRAVTDNDSGKYLNEDNDIRSVLQYLLDDVSDFISQYFNNVPELDVKPESDGSTDKTCSVGCSDILKDFLDYISVRETENFQLRKQENQNSVTLTTIHQSKGLEWDTVFIVKCNDSEIPLLHEHKGLVTEGGMSIEEERRLLYVAMTRAKKKLYILYVLMDSNWQVLLPSRFLRELPNHLITNADKDSQMMVPVANANCKSLQMESEGTSDSSNCNDSSTKISKNNHCIEEHELFPNDLMMSEACFDNSFLKRFNVEERATISQLFHRWAKKAAFQDPKKLLDKVQFVIDERLRKKASKSKEPLRVLRATLSGVEAFQYAQHVLSWEKIPLDKRTHLMREKQEHFQKLRVEKAMGSSEATSKQIAYLQTLGCTITPTSRLHASKLIEQYKSL